MKKETCIQWLERVSEESEIPAARRAAKNALSNWEGLSESWKEREVLTRRSLWDLVAGVYKKSHQDSFTMVLSGHEAYIFPVLAEACEYRGKTVPACVIPTGVRPDSYRMPQTAKWGNEILRT